LPGPRQDYDDGRVVATVGTIPILAGDVRALLTQRIREKAKSASQEMPSADDMKTIYAMYMRPMLKSMVETKLIVNDAKQTIPAAGLAKLEEEMNHEFDKTEMPKLMKTYKADSQHDLDQALRAEGSSLDWERRMYTEKNIEMGWI